MCKQRSKLKTSTLIQVSYPALHIVWKYLHSLHYTLSWQLKNRVIIRLKFILFKSNLENSSSHENSLNWAAYTHGGENLTTLLVKYFNDLPGVQRSERNRNEVTFFYVGDVLRMHLGSKYANFQEKIFPETSWRRLFHSFDRFDNSKYNEMVSWFGVWSVLFS